MLTTLITGGAGFIGSHLIHRLIAQGDQKIVNVDSLTYAGVEQSLADIAENPNYCLEQYDIADNEAMAEVFARHQPHRVFHLAAESMVDRSIDSAGIFIKTNVVGTTVLLEHSLSCYKNLSPSRRAQFRFVHISTDEVYGDLPHPDDEKNLTEQDRLGFSETSNYCPSSPYSASKAASDHFVRSWFRTYDLPILISNCSNNYGPRQLPEKLIPKIILNALNGQPLPIYGAGQQIRDWLYVGDHVEALLQIADRGQVGQSYNIGGNNQIRNLDVVTKICHLLEDLAPAKPDHITQYSDLIHHISDRPGHDGRYAIDARKLHKDLSWQPQINFATGLAQTVQWYLAHPEWTQAALAKMSA